MLIMLKLIDVFGSSGVLWYHIFDPSLLEPGLMQRR
jgi:hypothetical protein